MHPSLVQRECPDLTSQIGFYFFRDDLREHLPDPDDKLLASLEREGVPTIHNMILGDRVVSKLPYRNALAYATFLARRLIHLFRDLKPSVVIGGYDAIHGGLALAVARQMNIPWYALHFSVIPPGLACFCDQMSPAARVFLKHRRSSDAIRSLAETALRKFEERNLQAPAYIAPGPLPVTERVKRLPRRLVSLARRFRKRRDREFLQFTEASAGHSVVAALKHFRRQAVARNAISKVNTLEAPPSTPYVFFGLHFQPESAIDVWAPYFSNQMWTIELLSRSVPPTHRLLVKIHKSDAAKYSESQLRRMQSFPGVELVRPFADTRSFIERADLVFSIQGTIGLEAALLGKPVIVLGDSPVALFPSAVRIGRIDDLSILIRERLRASAPSREEILNAYCDFLAPFIPAAHNDWLVSKGDEEVRGFVDLFGLLREHLSGRGIPCSSQRDKT